MKTTTFACAAILALHGAALAGGEGWSHDFEAAKKQAASEKKDLLMDFTGSDWCGWCIKLNDEVFKHEPFKAGVKDTFVLVELDYPRDESKVSEETKKQNEELRDKYAIQGYPTILLCDYEGRPYAATGYEKGGPEKYVSHLNELRGNKAKRDEAFAKAEKSEGVEKAKALVAALDIMRLDEGLVANFYGKLPEQIKAADPKDETGFKKKEEAKQRLTSFQMELQKVAQEGDMDAALALVDKTLKESGFGKEETLQIMMTRAMIFAQQKKFDDALKAIDEAKTFAPDSPMMESINEFRTKLEEMKNKPAGEKDEEADEEEDVE